MGIFIAPHDQIILKHKATADESTFLLASNGVKEPVQRGIQWFRTRPKHRDYGKFYAMESYHWFWETHLVQKFLNHFHLASYALNTTEQWGPFIEETFNHFIYPDRALWGYNFVDLYAEVKRIVGQ